MMEDSISAIICKYFHANSRLWQHRADIDGRPGLLHPVRHRWDSLYALRDRRRRSNLRNDGLSHLEEVQAYTQTYDKKGELEISPKIQYPQSIMEILHLDSKSHESEKEGRRRRRR